tara:strand:- start:1492 stop:1758 length:267 start_codon:yes stop_codon:yes gene_type:complete
MIEAKHDGSVLIKYEKLNRRLEKFGMHIKAWGYIAVCLDSDPYSGYVLNNVKDIDVVEGFVLGLEYIHENKPEIVLSEDPERGDPNAG